MSTVKGLATQMDDLQEKITALEARIDSHEDIMARLATAMTTAMNQMLTIRDLTERVAAHETTDQAQTASWYHW